MSTESCANILHTEHRLLARLVAHHLVNRVFVVQRAKELHSMNQFLGPDPIQKVTAQES
jgi:hypothetical protein